MKKLIELAKAWISKIKLSRGVALGIIIGAVIIILAAIAIFADKPANKSSGEHTSAVAPIASSALPQSSMANDNIISPIEEPSAASEVPVESQPQKAASSSVAQSGSSTADKEANNAAYKALLKALSRWDVLQMDPVEGDVKAHIDEIKAANDIWNKLTADSKEQFARDNEAENKLLVKYFELLARLK